MSIVDQWEKDASKLLLNRTIVKVRYMSSDEVEFFGWQSKAIVLHLDDGTMLFPSRDDEVEKRSNSLDSKIQAPPPLPSVSSSSKEQTALPNHSIP